MGSTRFWTHIVPPPKKIVHQSTWNWHALSRWCDPMCQKVWTLAQRDRPGIWVKYHVHFKNYFQVLEFLPNPPEHIYESIESTPFLRRTDVIRWGLISYRSQLQDQKFSPPLHVLSNFNCWFDWYVFVINTVSLYVVVRTNTPIATKYLYAVSML